MSFWAVPKTGGYPGGTITGTALAHLYLKHLEEHGTGISGGILRNIVLGRVECDNNVSPEQNALCGQVVGFFSVLDKWIAAAAKHLEGGIDGMDTKALLDLANYGLMLRGDE